jgi:O-antigen/teichoic acid export membrane protein
LSLGNRHQAPAGGEDAPSSGVVSGFLSEVGLYGVGNVLARFMGVISTAVLARLLTVAQFGQLDFLQTLVSVGVVFFSLQTEVSLIRLYHAATDRDRGVLLTTQLALVTAVGLVLVPAVWLLAGTAVEWLAPEPAWRFDPAGWPWDVPPLNVLFQDDPSGLAAGGWPWQRPPANVLFPAPPDDLQPQWMAPLIMSGFWYNHTQILLRTSRRVGAAVVFSSLVVLVQVVLAVPLALVWGVAGVLIARFVAETGGSIVIVLRHRREYAAGLSWDWLKRLCRMGLPMLPNPAAQGILGNMNRYLLIVFWGATSLGLFSVAFRVSLILGAVVGAIKTAWLPFAFSEGEDDRAVARQLDIFRSYLWTMFLMCLGVMVFAVDIVRVVAGTDYEAAAPVTGLLCASVVFQGAIYFLSTPFMSRERTVPIMIANLAGGALAAGFSILMIPWWGLTAAAAIQMASNLAVNLCLWAWLRFRLGLCFPAGGLIGIAATVSLVTWLITPPLMAASFWVRLGIGLVVALGGGIILQGELKRLGFDGGWRGLARNLVRLRRA